jgi:hypothetical protein
MGTRCNRIWVWNLSVLDLGMEMDRVTYPQFKALGLMKYGAVKVVTQAPRNPTAAARPNV